MKKRVKKLLSLLFACALCLSIFSFFLECSAQEIPFGNTVKIIQKSSDLQAMANKYGIPNEKNKQRLSKIVLSYTHDNNPHKSINNTLSSVIKPQWAWNEYDYATVTSTSSVCGIHAIHQTSGMGPGNLICTVNQGVSATFSANVGVTADVITAAVGFSVTSTYSVSDSQSVTLKDGQSGTISAMPLYSIKEYDIYHVPMLGNTYYKGHGNAKKPLGVCFSVYLD